MEKTRSYRVSDFTQLEITCRDCESKLSFKMARKTAESEIKNALFGWRTCPSCGSSWGTGQGDVRYQALAMVLEGIFEARRHDAISNYDLQDHHDVPRVHVSLAAPEAD
jgi:hypothetical protein